ncbi:hypothetical protein HMPREF9440_01535 [Sutterella parvirubra YIT 11816]|uniref:Uncharacterized protein n=1 Tax=Sutterella parvirubra YIT 11816 TaxID=762967 RepID=H3KFL6_9BURK|nr:hypothetical protein HMPREF9440_01535 [Sutterella parvirubra YIT 11816]
MLENQRNLTECVRQRGGRRGGFRFLQKEAPVTLAGRFRGRLLARDGTDASPAGCTGWRRAYARVINA